jgi:transcriptional regulator with XRE-family HTH domain
MDEVGVIIGENLKDLRMRRGLSIRAVSLHSGVPRTTLQDIESGKNKPGFDTLIALLNFFSVKLEEIFPPLNAMNIASDQIVDATESVETVAAELQ